jgi:hypothetical protein
LAASLPPGKTSGVSVVGEATNMRIETLDQPITPMSATTKAS